MFREVSAAKRKRNSGKGFCIRTDGLFAPATPAVVASIVSGESSAMNTLFGKSAPARSATPVEAIVAGIFPASSWRAI